MKENNERENNRRNQWNKNYLKNINITDNSITILTKGGDCKSQKYKWNDHYNRPYKHYRQ